MPNYWVVGAAWGGTEHQDKAFIEKGIWMLGWEEGHQPEKAMTMEPGDRIAIKCGFRRSEPPSPREGAHPFRGKRPTHRSGATLAAWVTP